MKRFRVVAAVVCMIFLSSVVVLIPFANADWTMFHADPSHSGAGTGNPALTPTLLWSYTTGGSMAYSSPAVVDGVVYVGAGNVYALNAANGIQLWNYTTTTTGSSSMAWSSPAVVDGVVYIGSDDGNVYALGGSPTPSPTTVPAKTDNGTTVDLTISGNVTSTQISNITIATDQSAASTMVSFTLTGESGTTGFGNVTIPKSALPYGTTPTIYIDNQPAQDQGYTQDANNYYVWYTAHFSTHQVSIVFTAASSSSLPQEAIYAVAATVAIVAIVAVALVLRKSKKN